MGWQTQIPRGQRRRRGCVGGARPGAELGARAERPRRGHPRQRSALDCRLPAVKPVRYLDSYRFSEIRCSAAHLLLTDANTSGAHAPHSITTVPAGTPAPGPVPQLRGRRGKRRLSDACRYRGGTVEEQSSLLPLSILSVPHSCKCYNSPNASKYICM